MSKIEVIYFNDRNNEYGVDAIFKINGKLNQNTKVWYIIRALLPVSSYQTLKKLKILIDKDGKLVQGEVGIIWLLNRVVVIDYNNNRGILDPGRVEIKEDEMVTGIIEIECDNGRKYYNVVRKWDDRKFIEAAISEIIGQGIYDCKFARVYSNRMHLLFTGRDYRYEYYLMKVPLSCDERDPETLYRNRSICYKIYDLYYTKVIYGTDGTEKGKNYILEESSYSY